MPRPIHHAIQSYPTQSTPSPKEKKEDQASSGANDQQTNPGGRSEWMVTLFYFFKKL